MPLRVNVVRTMYIILYIIIHVVFVGIVTVRKL